MNPFGTGAIHTEDRRDYKYLGKGAMPETLPASYQTPQIAPLMQGQRPSCVSHAIVRLMQFYWWKKTGKVIDFSPRFLHAYTSTGMADADGRDPRIVAGAAKTVGCCTTALLPNDVSLNDHDYTRVQITQEMLDEAAQYKMPAYSFVPIDSYSLRHAIYHKGGVALLFRIGNEWWTPNWLPQYINPLKPPAVEVGGHEVTGEHWNTLEGIQNSWSDQWDEKGYGEYDLANYRPIQALVFDDPLVDFQDTRFVFNKNLWWGQNNHDVLELQKRLGVIQTGFFGNLTLRAVIAYQKANNIYPQLGFVGPLTRAKLNKV